MKIWSDKRSTVAESLGGGALGLIALLLLSSASGIAQTVQTSIITIQQPASGHAVFDTSGNAYYLWVPPGWSDMETTLGSGVCVGGPRPAPCLNAFVSKVDPSGNRMWIVNMGGPSIDKGTALAVDADGKIVFTGFTNGQFPTTAGAAIESSVNAKVFAVKLSPEGSVLYSTYLPESLASSSAIAVDAAGNAYIAGKTSEGHAYALKLSADGSTILYNTTLAGSGTDAATAITVDSAGNGFLAGQTTSPDFPVTGGAFQRQLKGAEDNFLVKLSPSGSVLTGTYFGGSGSDRPSSIAIDGSGNIDLAGYTSSLDLPTTQGTMQTSAILPPWNSFGPGGFVAQFAPDGISLKWASYVMSSDLNPVSPNWDIGVSALAVGTAGDIYLGGLTGPGFPVTASAPVFCFPGNRTHTNGFLAHLNSSGALIDATYLGSSTAFSGNLVGGLSLLPDSPVLIAWTGSVGGVVSKVQFGRGGTGPSACLSTNVLNSATLSGSAGIAPGELVTLTGFGIGPDIGAVYQPDAQGNIPTQLAGVQVLFDGVPVPIMYAQSEQINAVAPAGLTVNGTTQVTLTYNNRQFGPAVANVIAGSPGIFRLQLGQSAQAIAINEDGTLNGSTNPAARGSIVAVWGTGYGQTDPPCQSGGVNLPYAAPLSPGISARIYNGDPSLLGALQPASVKYAGSAPGLPCGVAQVNFEVPLSIAPGTYLISPGVAGNATLNSLTGATIAVK